MPIFLGEQLNGAVQACKDTTSLDIANENYRCVDTSRNPQIRDITVIEVDLSRTSGTFNDDYLI
jgi:hypothetical protein